MYACSLFTHVQSFSMAHHEVEHLEKSIATNTTVFFKSISAKNRRYICRSSVNMQVGRLSI